VPQGEERLWARLLPRNANRERNRRESDQRREIVNNRQPLLVTEGNENREPPECPQDSRRTMEKRGGPTRKERNGAGQKADQKKKTGAKSYSIQRKKRPKRALS